MTNKTAISNGYTILISAMSDSYDLNLLVKPDADTDGTFKAWDTEEREFILVNGWLFNIAEIAEYTTAQGVDA